MLVVVVVGGEDAKAGREQSVRPATPSPPPLTPYPCKGMAAPDGGPLSPCGPLTSCTARWRAVLTQSIRMTSPARQKLPHLQCKNLPLCLTPVPFDRSTSSWLERHDIKKERMRQEGVKEGWGWSGRRENKSFVPPPTTPEKKKNPELRPVGRDEPHFLSVGKSLHPVYCALNKDTNFTGHSCFKQFAL